MSQEGGSDEDIVLFSMSVERDEDIPAEPRARGPPANDPEVGGGPQRDKLLEALHLPQLVARNQGV